MLDVSSLRIRSLVAGCAMVVLSSCSEGDRKPVVAYTSVDQVFSEPIFRACETTHGLRVRAVFDTEETKSTGVLNRLLAEASHPQADVFWSGDPVRPFVLVERGLVEPYVSTEAAAIPDGFRAADGTWTGLAARARVLLIDTAQLPADQRPTSVEELADPRFKGRAAIANPLFGTTTMHAAALFSSWGDERAQAFFRALSANDVRVASSNGEVKRLVLGGEVAFGLTDTDDAFAAVAERPELAVVYPDSDRLGTLVMPTSVVLLRGGPNPAGGRELIDCLLSARSEEELVRAGGHIPLRDGVAAPPGVPSAGAIRSMSVDYSAVATTMQRIQPWLREWMGL